MKLKYNFIVNEVADQMIAVAVGDDLSKFNGFIKMNGTGAFIFNLLKNDVTEDEIVAEILKAYDDATEEAARETVEEFIAGLKKSDVLENV